MVVVNIATDRKILKLSRQGSAKSRILSTAAEEIVTGNDSYERLVNWKTDFQQLKF